MAEAAPRKPVEIKRPEESWRLVIAVSAFLGWVSFGICLTLLGWTSGSAWLHGAVVVCMALLLALVALAGYSLLKNQMRQHDTATSSIQAAPQGEIELRGTVQPVPGAELRSLFLDNPCASYQCTLTGYLAGSGSVAISLLSEKGRRSFLLSDGTGEVFVPGSLFVTADIEVESGKTLGTLPPEIVERLARSGTDAKKYASFHAREYRIPIGLRVQVNGVFATLRPQDSYLTVCKKQRNFLPPTAEELATHPDEADWRAYAKAAGEAAKPTGLEPRLNVLLPADTLGSIYLTEVGDGQEGRAYKTLTNLLGLAAGLVAGLLMAAGRLPYFK